MVIISSSILFYCPDRETGLQRLRVIGRPGTKMLKVRFLLWLLLQLEFQNLSLSGGISGGGVKLTYREAFAYAFVFVCE